MDIDVRRVTEALSVHHVLGSEHKIEWSAILGTLDGLALLKLQILFHVSRNFLPSHFDPNTNPLALPNIDQAGIEACQ